MTTSTLSSTPATTALQPPPRFRDGGLLGPLRAFQDDPLSLMAAAAEAEGDVVEVRLGPRTVLFLRDPEHVEHVLVHNLRGYTKRTRGYRMMRKVLGWGLVTSEGDFWRRQRRIAQPGFSRRRIASFAETMTRATERMLDDRWAPAAASGEPLDVSAEMMRVTLEIVSATLLGIESGADADDVADAVPVVLEHIVHRITHPLSPHELVPTPRNRRYRRAKATLDRIVDRIIAERRRAEPPEEGGDLLDMLMNARDEETGEGMSDRQLRDEVMTIYLAGHETTAMALGWTMHLLGQHPQWYARVCEELDSVLGGRTPSLEDLRSLDVTKRVIEESMRLYPPVWLLGRTALEEDSVAGYRIPRGRLVFVSPWLTHRNPRYWPDPDRFDPDRFLPDARKARPRMAYLPFSGGQRKCIGDHFAMMEAQLILATVLSRYDLSPITEHPIEAQTAVTLRPRHGIPMRVARRAVRSSS